MTSYFERPVFIGTFHKTGTVLLHGIAKRIARRLGLELWTIPSPPDRPEPRTDWDLAVDIFAFMGFHPDDLGFCLEIAGELSLFSGKPVMPGHVIHGRTELWRSEFDDDLHAAFRERFGDAAERLGYPTAEA